MTKNKFKLVRLDEEENRELEQAARRLGLSVSELLRRSWRIATPKFEKLNAPGVRMREDESR